MERVAEILAWLRFSDPLWLLLLPVVGGYALSRWLAGRRHRPGVLFPGVARLRREKLAVNPVAGALPATLRWLAFTAGVLALAGPRAPIPASDLASNGIDLMLALDVSESMRQRDFDGKSRFDAAREAAREFIDSRPADRMGLLIFSGGSFTSCPLTLDHDLLGRLVDTIEPGVIREPGTAMGMAVLTAVNRLKASESGEKVLVLLTDGENNSGEVAPGTAARLAAQSGIRIYTVFAGKGSSALPAGAAETAPAVRPGRADLAEMARVSGGRSFSAGDPDGLGRTFRDIDRLEKHRLLGRRQGRSAELYPWLLLAAGLLLAAETALSSTRLMRIP